MNFLIRIFVIWFTVSFASFANEIKVFDFTETELSELDVRKVRGADNKTIYTVGSNEKGNFLKAVADNAASGLGNKLAANIGENAGDSGEKATFTGIFVFCTLFGLLVIAILKPLNRLSHGAEDLSEKSF